MLRAPLRAALAALLLTGGGRVARAQQDPTLEIRLPATDQLATSGPLVLATNMLASPHFREPLAAGFPARFHFLVTLWSEGGLTNAIERRAEYYVLVEYHVTEKKYEVVQLLDDRPPFSLGKFDRVEDAERAVARPTRVAITAFPSKKRFYYRATLDVQILGASDLDEVNRWLKGELGPAIHGERNPGTALARSIRMLASRLLGGDSREFEAKTDAFSVP
ncbi:MAG: hypothetical protein ACHQSE_06350 [Gemmatimonadales bacterium]